MTPLPQIADKPEGHGSMNEVTFFGGVIAAGVVKPGTDVDALDRIIGHLGAAIGQSLPSDDQIIMGHVRSAHERAQALRESSKGAERFALPDRNCDFCGPGWTGAHKHRCPRALEDYAPGPVDD